jgi:UDP-N-acetyl-D-glucosamine dehydrogenase
MIKQMRVAIIGQGYVGLTITEGALLAGHQVIGIDKSAAVVSGLKSGKSHIEGITDSVIANAVNSGAFQISESYSQASEADVVVIAVPTPLDAKGSADLSLLTSSAKSLGEVLKSPKLIINESTSYPGTLREVIKPLVDGASGQSHLYAISPERVDPGNKSYGVRNTPRVVGGLSDQARDAAVAFYKTFCDEVVPVSSAEVAEAAKLFENTFRFINIGLVNEFAEIMSAMGIPADEVLKAAGSKPYGFMPFHPNVGIGGHCIPVDPIYLQERAKEFGITSKYIALSEEINHRMPKYVAKRLMDEYGDIKGKKVLVVGVSYKADISDTRESPAQPFIESLKELGAEVSWHDPLVSSWNGESSSSIAGAYDLAVVLVAHSNLSMSGWKGGPIFTTNFNPKFPDWKPLISVQQKS